MSSAADTPVPDSARKRSTSRSRTSRPTTPLRPSSRSSFRESAKSSTGGDASFPLNTFEPAFAELSDAMADLEANLMHFQLMHESLARFSESFASFLYGLNMNAFCVDFPEVSPRVSLPLLLDHSLTIHHHRGLLPSHFAELSNKRSRAQHGYLTGLPARWTARLLLCTLSHMAATPYFANVAARTTDTSFVENPPTSSKATPKFQTPEPRVSRVPAPSTRGGAQPRGARGNTRGTRPSGLARPKGRGVR